MNKKDREFWGKVVLELEQANTYVKKVSRLLPEEMRGELEAGILVREEVMREATHKLEGEMVRAGKVRATLAEQKEWD